jgi:hypothetical protein
MVTWNQSRTCSAGGLMRILEALRPSGGRDALANDDFANQLSRPLRFARMHVVLCSAF